jgi:hypothetical protein
MRRKAMQFVNLSCNTLNVLNAVKMKGFKVASHSYASAHADWTLSKDENQATVLYVTLASEAANAIAVPTAGKVFLVINGSGYAITLKAADQTGVAVANGVANWLCSNGAATDFISAGLSAAVAGSSTVSGIVELATAAEVLAFADTGRVVIPLTDGLSNSIIQTTDAAVTAAQMHGQTHVVTGAATLTLPTVAAGLNAKVLIIGTISVSIKAGASDKITLHATALDDGDKITADASGEWIEIMANAAGTDWQTGCYNGTWTDGGA